MDIKFLGTEYGGWEIDLDSIDHGDVIIDAGLGEDISFLEDLKNFKTVKIIGVDPTEKSHAFVEKKNLENLILIKKAIAPKGIDFVKMHKNANPNYVSESIISDHGSVDSNTAYTIQATSFSDLIAEYSPSLIKMDIEGAEYGSLEECIGIKQICVEFHHHCLSSKNLDDTLRCIKKMESEGYEVISNRRNIEFTLLKR